MSNISIADIRIIKRQAELTQKYGTTHVGSPFAAQNYQEQIERLGAFAGSIADLLVELLECRGA